MEINTGVKLYPLNCHQVIKKSESSTKFKEDNPNLIIQEVKLFTGISEDLKSNNLRETKHKLTIEDYNEIPLEKKISSQGLQTREVSSNKIFFVKEEMLTYRGKSYSFNDIATNWKKDCRKWLWKSNKPKPKMKESNDKIQ